MHGSRVFFAGDAAGVVDPMTGEGIAQASRPACSRQRPSPTRTEPSRSRLTDARSQRRSAPTFVSPALQRCSRTRVARGAYPSTSTTGHVATLPAGCSRTIRAPSSLRRAGGEAISPRRIRRGQVTAEPTTSGEGKKKLDHGEPRGIHVEGRWRIRGTRTVDARHRVLHGRRRRAHARDDGDGDQGTAPHASTTTSTARSRTVIKSPIEGLESHLRRFSVEPEGTARTSRRDVAVKPRRDARHVPARLRRLSSR